MPTTAIKVTDLHKTYAGRPVLDGVSFAVGAGEIFGIAGRNGAGKTTTVEIVQCLRDRDSGTVSVLGSDPARDPKRVRSLIGAQLQSAALPDRMRVGEALALFARLASAAVDWHSLARDWGLDKILSTPFGVLSGGQRQRLFLALALVNRPRVVFLDELTTGLDPAARREAWALVKRARDHGTTIVLVTHDMEEAERLCDRVAVLDHGRLVACGRPVEIITATGTVHVRFSTSIDHAGRLRGLPSVINVGYDGACAELTLRPDAVVSLAAELDHLGIRPVDFTVIRPSLEDAVLQTLNGDPR